MSRVPPDLLFTLSGIGSRVFLRGQQDIVILPRRINRDARRELYPRLKDAGFRRRKGHWERERDTTGG